MSNFTPSAFESSRFQAWIYCALFSLVCLISYPYDEKFSPGLWLTTALSMAFSFGVSVAYDKDIESSVAEGGTAVLLLIFWVCSLPFIMSINGRGFMEDANLYVFSWVSFMCVLFVVQDLAKEKAKRARRLMNNDNASKVAKCFGLAVVAVVLVASASVDRDLFNCMDFPGDPRCVRLAFGIALGAITIPLSVGLGIFSMRSVLTTKAEASAAILALILHIFGVIFLTLGNNAPANYVDNTFFSTWISFFFSALLTRQCLADLYKQHTESTDVSSTEVVHGQAFAVADDIENVERAIDDDDGHSA